MNYVEKKGIYMAKQEEVVLALELFHKNRPQKIFNEIDKTEVGVFAVIKYLYESKTTVTSADICKSLQISSARMAVLIKRLESKGLVIKMNSQFDSRTKILKLSENGEQLANEVEMKMYHTMGKIVDEFGINELKEMFEKLTKLKTILHENAPTNLEEYND